MTGAVRESAKMFLLQNVLAKGAQNSMQRFYVLTELGLMTRHQARITPLSSEQKSNPTKAKIRFFVSWLGEEKWPYSIIDRGDSSRTF